MSNPGISLSAAPDYSLQQAQVLQQQQLARALAQMGNEPIQAQSAGGIAGPISSLSVLAKALNSFGGAYLSGKANSDNAALNKQEKDDASKLLASFYKQPDTQGLTPNVTDQPQQMSFSAPPVGGGPGMTANVTAQMPTVGTPQAGTIPGEATPYPQQQQMINQFAMSDNPYLQKIAPELYAQTKPSFTALPPGQSLMQVQNGQVTPTGISAPRTMTENERNAAALYGPNFATDPRYIEQLKRESLGVKSPEAQAQAVAQARAMADARSQGTTVPTTDPAVANFAANVHTGLVQIRSIPMQYRRAVSDYLANEKDQTGSPTTTALYAGAAKKITDPYTSNPQYQLYANAQPFLQRMQAAAGMRSSIGDTDLIDSLVKLETGGNAITDAQVLTSINGQSVADRLNVLKNKAVAQGGILSDDQRKEAMTLGNQIYDNYKRGYTPLYEAAAKQLKASAIPEAFWTIPDLNQFGTGLGSKPAAQSGGWGTAKVINP